MDLAPTKCSDLSFRLFFIQKKTEESIGLEICGVLRDPSKARVVTLTTKHIRLVRAKVPVNSDSIT